MRSSILQAYWIRPNPAFSALRKSFRTIAHPGNHCGDSIGSLTFCPVSSSMQVKERIADNQAQPSRNLWTTNDLGFHTWFFALAFFQGRFHARMSQLSFKKLVAWHLTKGLQHCSTDLSLHQMSLEKGDPKKIILKKMGFWQKTPNSVKVEIRSLVLGKCSKSLTNFFKICNRFNRCACILPAHIELSKWPFGFFPVNFQPLTPTDYALNSPFAITAVLKCNLEKE